MSDRTVADGDVACFGEGLGGLAYDHGADKDHGAMGQLGTGRLFIAAVW